MDHDRVLGMLYGVAIGDAIGAPFEFRNTKPKPIWTGLVSADVHTIRFQYSSITLVQGSVTDDTEMTLAMLSSILDKRVWDKDSVTKNYLDWANSKPIGMGVNTRLLMKGVTTLKGFQKRWDSVKVEDWQDRQSNGTLMRATPLALLGQDEWPNASDQDVNLTNNNDINRLCNRIYVSALRSCIWREPIELDCAWMEPVPIVEAVQDALAGVIRDISDKKVKGWVVTALYVALLSLFRGEGYQDSLEYISTKFLGVKDGVATKVMDADTIMAIAGGLVGARVGLEAMIKESKTRENIERIRAYFNTTTRPYKITTETEAALLRL